MADGITVRIVGPDLVMLATMVSAKVVAAAEEDLDAIAELVKSDAVANCPVAGDTAPVTKYEVVGLLRDDIQVTSSGGKRDIGNMNVPYAIYVHNGTWKMKGRPYLLNASEANKSKWISIILAHPGVI